MNLTAEQVKQLEDIDTYVHSIIAGATTGNQPADWVRGELVSVEFMTKQLREAL